MQTVLQHKINAQLRKYCTCCEGKFYAKDMVKWYYPLLKKAAWHCQKCVSTLADNLHKKISYKKPHFIELFAGSKTVSNTAALYGYTTVTVDVNPKFQPDIIADIQNLKLNQVPGSDNAFIVWASIPCDYYTILNIKNHWEKITYASRQYFYYPKTREARLAIRLLEKTLYIIRKINPTYFFIENPRGALRHMPQMKGIPFLHTVSYSDYGFKVYKPTDIFTNCPFLKLCQIKTAVGRNFEENICDMSGAYERSIVPGQLIENILSQIKQHHKF